ncbi:SH3 domain-containing protein [Muricoccus radiodurans]|uniref:SH3 domain-containing protein n=1 Tax=Muricoccus radiodurans TaxID=2231721 RepID=UPI003CEE4EDE
MRTTILLSGLVLLGGCWESSPSPSAAAPETNHRTAASARIQQVQAAAEDRVRSLGQQDRDGLRFRAVQTYRQAVPDTFAVCGQATLSGSAGAYIPFVSVVSSGDGGLQVEQHVARTNIEATRVYAEMVARCFDGGGPVPRPGGPPVAMPPPPLPSGLTPVPEPAPADPSQGAVTLVSAAAPSPTPAVATPAQRSSGTLVMRQNGNVRSSPNGGGAVLRVARTGSNLQIFGTAPGGWYQVGESAPEGWVHGSLASVQ